MCSALLLTCGTPRLYRKSLKLIFQVRSCTNSEPCCFPPLSVQLAHAFYLVLESELLDGLRLSLLSIYLSILSCAVFYHPQGLLDVFRKLPCLRPGRHGSGSLI